MKRKKDQEVTLPTQRQTDSLYIEMLEPLKKRSHGVRAKVGAILVTEHGNLLVGINGLPKNLGNKLEIEEVIYDGGVIGVPPQWVLTGRLITKPTVIHAEMNCILKAAREGVSTVNSTVYVSLSPCAHCASMLVSAGVKRLVYVEDYRDPSGLDVLRRCHVEVVKYEPERYKVSKV